MIDRVLLLYGADDQRQEKDANNDRTGIVGRAATANVSRRGRSGNGRVRSVDCGIAT